MYCIDYSSYYYKITPEYKEWIEASLGVSEKTLEDIYAEKNASNPMFNIETDKDIGENFSNDLEDFGEHIGESINFDGNGKGEWIFRLHAISENMTGTLYLDDEVKLEKAHNRWWMNSWWMEYGEYMRNVKGYDYATPEYLETSSRYSLKINNGTVMSKNYK